MQQFLQLCVRHAASVAPHRFAVTVDEVLHVHANCTCALVQDGELGFVVEQSGHLHKYTIISHFEKSTNSPTELREGSVQPSSASLLH